MTDADSPLVRPFGGRRAPRLGPLALLVATQADLEALSAGTTALGQQRLYTSRLLRLRADLTLVGPLIGAPYAVMLLETLVAWGAHEIFFLGWCGALAPERAVGDLIVPQAAISDEGTSRHYGVAAGEPVQVEPSAAARLRSALAATGAEACDGIVWSTDGVFRETPSAIGRFRGLGATVVEMELAALLSAGRHLGVSVAGLLVVSDLLSGPSWQPGFKLDAFHSGRQRAARAVCHLCRIP